MSISEVIEKLQELQENYGDVEVMIHSTGGETEYVNEIFINEYKNSKGVETVITIW